MKVHFDPYLCGEHNESADRYPCGTRVWFEYNATGDWDEVTCKKCLSQRECLQKWYEKTEEAINNYYHSMVKAILAEEEEEK